ncbi:MAG: pyridoxamine 5'-phosphate oxidase family protein [SAR324 cluster bacterium]|nr:pyridoxamine 5'-phosphate oxidase family protein [SAR324 cluster bacterium]
MAEFYNELNEDLSLFIEKQKIFFVSTVPNEGRINLSPKGHESFYILNDNEVCFLNLVGSGNETEGHLKEDPRITIMFCSFEKSPNILKIYGQGRSITPRSPEWETLYSKMKTEQGARQIIAIKIDSVQTSCGYSVPFFEYQGERETLRKWAEKKGDIGVAEYMREKNVTTIDGKPTGLFD